MTETYDNFFEALGQSESSGNYETVNKPGYLGKYQMSEDALIDAGYYTRSGDTTRENDFIGQWTGKDGIQSKEDYLNSQTAQENAVREFADKNWGYLTYLGNLDQYIGQTIGGIEITESGLIAGAHLKGVGKPASYFYDENNNPIHRNETWNMGIRAFLESNGDIDGKDGNKTSVSGYVDKFKSYETPFQASLAPTPTLRPGDFVQIGSGNYIVQSAEAVKELLKNNNETLEHFLSQEENSDIAFRYFQDKSTGIDYFLYKDKEKLFFNPVDADGEVAEYNLYKGMTYYNSESDNPAQEALTNSLHLGYTADEFMKAVGQKELLQWLENGNITLDDFFDAAVEALTPHYGSSTSAGSSIGNALAGIFDAYSTEAIDNALISLGFPANVSDNGWGSIDPYNDVFDRQTLPFDGNEYTFFGQGDKFSLPGSGIGLSKAGFLSILPWIKDIQALLGYASGLLSPLTLDLDGDGVELLHADHGVYFDIDNDGFAEQIGWVAADDGQLAMDRNGNGVIDNITELYGDDVMPAFDKLRLEDSNKDGVINAQDSNYAKLLVWRDKDADGQTDAGELQSLEKMGVTSISLNVQPENRWLNENYISAKSTFVINGVTREIDDVHYLNNNINSYFVGYGQVETVISINPLTLLLPLSRGYGTLPALHIAMDKDPVLLQMVKDFAHLPASQSEEIYGRVEDILYQWAGVTDVDTDRYTTGSGNYIDGRKVAFMDAFFGQPFLQIGQNDMFGFHASEKLSEAWQELVAHMVTRLAVQGPLASIFPHATYDFKTDRITLHDSLEAIVTRAQTYAAALNNNSGEAYAFWVQLGHIMVQEREALGVTTEQIRSVLSNAAHMPIYVSEGHYTLKADNGDNTVHGLDGGDYIYALEGNDLVYGEGGDDYIEGGKGQDTLYGNAGTDRIFGGEGNDNLYGEEGDDQLSGEYGADTVYGGAGNDHITMQLHKSGGGLEADMVDGGEGVDTLWVWGSSDTSQDGYAGVYVDMRSGKTGIMEGGNPVYLTTTFSHIENIAGSNRNDIIYGDAGNNVINGEGGDDYIDGGDGDDNLFGESGNDRLFGGNGNDYLQASPGNTYMDGGAGVDWVSYSHPYITSAVEVNLLTGRASGAGSSNGSWAEGDSFVNIENVFGTDYDDTITGNGADNVLRGWKGDDRLYGNGGQDTLYGEEGDDRLFGDGGDDQLCGNEGNDELHGNEGQDTLYGQEGNDRLYGEEGNDELYGDVGEDIIYGGVGNDGLYGNKDNDSLYGEDGDDKLYGGDGTDVMSGGVGNDELYGHKDNDSLYGNEGDDKLYGSSGSDALWGGVGADILDGDVENDNLFGEDGDDTLIGGLGADKMDGGDGRDTVSYASSGAVHINLLTGTYSGSAAEGDTLSHIENIIGSAYSDTLTGDNGNNYLYGNKGNDTLYGNAGDDQLYGEDGDDALTGGIGNDVLSGGSGKDKFIITPSAGSTVTITDFNVANEIIDVSAFGNLGSFEALTKVTSGADTILFLPNGQKILLKNVLLAEIKAANFLGLELRGTAGNDTIAGSSLDDRIYAGAGDDVIRGAMGADYIDGEAGYDTVSYTDSTTAVDVNLLTGIGKGSTAEGDILVNIERIWGSSHNDVLRGNTQSNVLTGGAGDDALYGEAGNDTLEGGVGADSIDGGDGSDGAEYAGSNAGIQVDLSANTASGGHAEGDVLSNIEHVYGSKYEDFLRGNMANNNLQGRAGNDILEGLAGNDALDGGEGNDILSGGIGNDNISGGIGNDTLYGEEGNDTLNGNEGDDFICGGLGADSLTGSSGIDYFVYDTLSDSTRAAFDIIQDFVQDQDKIDLTPLHAAGIESFDDLSIAYNAARNETIISYQDPLLSAAGQFEIHLKNNLVLQADDFVGF